MTIQEQTQLIFGLAGISTASLAFVSALYAYFDSHSRLQESAYGLLAAIFFLSVSTVLLVIALLTTANAFISPGFLLAEVSQIFFVVSWLILFYTLFMLYGRVSHLRDKRFLKYVFPFSLVSKFRSKKYALTVKERTYASIGPYEWSKDEFQVIAGGYTALFTGPRNLQLSTAALDVLISGIENGETANYVCCTRPPYKIIDWLRRRKSLSSSLHKHFIIIDAFSAHLGYDDEILKDANEDIERDGIAIVNARGIAGVHSGANSAWYKTKKLLAKEGISYRVPNRCVYDSLSELSTFSSAESVRSFYQHCVAAERKYGMLSIFVEYDDVDSGLLLALKGVVDGIFVFSEDDTKRLSVNAEKLDGIDLAKYVGEKIWSAS